MSFIETPRFPDDIAYGAQGGPMYSTDVVATASGYEKRNQNWAQRASSSMWATPAPRPSLTPWWPSSTP